MTTSQLFSVQAPLVAEKLRNEGVVFSKKKFVAQKYGESSLLFTTIYDWFCRKVAENSIVEISGPQSADSPSDALYPYWAFFDLQNTAPQPDDQVLTLNIPIDQCVFFRCDEWTKILQLDFLQGDPSLAAEMKACGVDGRKAVLTAFYPDWKKCIMNSWDPLFRFDSQVKAALADGTADQQHLKQYLQPFQAAVFQLRREWVLE